MKERGESLLVIKSEKVLSGKQREALDQIAKDVQAKTGFATLITEDGMEASLYSDLRPLMEEQLTEQRRTNDLLAMLTEAMAEEEQDPDAEPTTYLDGTPCR